RTARVVLGVDQHCRVLVEPDVGAVVAAVGLPRPDHYGGHDLALPDGALRTGLLDGGGDHVADPRVAAAVAALHADHEDLPGAGVVGDAQSSLVLDHLARSSTSTSRHRLVRDSGRDSRTITVSPTCASSRSSC